MDLIEVVYAYAFPLLWLLRSVLPKKIARIWLLPLMVALNLSLVVFSFALAKEMYSLYQLAKSFGFQLSLQSLKAVEWSWWLIVLRNSLTVLLPLLFLKRTIAKGIGLSAVMLGLFWWDVIASLFLHNPIRFPKDEAVNWITAMNYGSFMVGLLGLLYLFRYYGNKE